LDTFNSYTTWYIRTKLGSLLIADARDMGIGIEGEATAAQSVVGVKAVAE
jgi:hypothetical protein